MSEITVSRQTGLVGVLMKVNVYINGECVANLSKDETVTLPLPEGLDMVKVYVDQRGAFTRSKEVIVKAGQTMELTKDDPRRELQIPEDAVSNGITANPR